MFQKVLAPIFVSFILWTVVEYFFSNLSNLTHFPVSLGEVSVDYTVDMEPLVVHLNRSTINFTDYIAKVAHKNQTRAQLRASLQTYLEPRLFIFHRTHESWNYDREWHHSSQLLIAKTVKDMII